VYSCDYVVVLDESLLEVMDVFAGLKAGGEVLINSARDAGAFAAGGRRVHTIDATGIALAVLGQPVTSTPMFGAFAGATGLVSLPRRWRRSTRCCPRQPGQEPRGRGVAYNESGGKIDA
jgi:pyruvate ferredoxin oxidoreductase gamma subunit